jgi:predicted ATPase
MLTELSLHEYRAHAATRVPLTPLSVLVGPNAVGKSSALEALFLLGRLLDAPPLEVLVGGCELRWLVRRGATEDLKIQVSGKQGEESWKLWATAPRDGDVLGTKLGWDVQYPPEVEAARDAAEQALGTRGPRPERPAGADALRGAVTLRLDSRRLAEPSISAEEVPRLYEDGYGLATVLSALKLSSTDRFHALEETACRIVPTLRAIRFKRTRLERQAPRTLTLEGQKVVVQEKEVTVADELVLDFADATGLPGHAASEGTLIVLGILATLYGPATPRLLLLEDVERALHPKAQRDLIAGIRGALAGVPETQIVATSHSPYLVDALAPEEVVVLGRGADGRVAARSLADHPKARLLEVLTSGELWTAEGESWVLGS